MANSFQRIDTFAGQRANYPPPNDESISPALKQEKEYALIYGRSILCEMVSGAYEFTFQNPTCNFGTEKRSMRVLHQYATGTYSTEKLKDSFIGKSPNKKKNGKHITKVSISFDRLPVISKLYDVVREKNMKQAYDVDANCLDDDSIQAKEADKAMLKYLVQDDTKEIMRRTKFKPNTKLDPQAIGLATEADVDLYFECGAYVFDRELASIAACNKTKLVSNYKVIQDGTFDDLIRYGIAGWKYEIDKTTNTVKLVKIEIYNPELDICPVLIPYSTSNNFENLSKFGWIRTLTIKEIREKNPELGPEELIDLCRNYQYLNPEYGNLIMGAYSSANGYNIDPLNRCKVLVLDYQWLGVDIENYVKNDRRTLFVAKDFDFELDAKAKRNGDKHIQKKVIKKFAAEWVIGTNIMLKYGSDEDIVYYGPDGDRCPGLDFFVTKTGNISLVERSIAVQDDIDLANTKLRNALASAVPSPRMVIQTGLLDNVFLNNIKQQPEDNMATFRELGYLMVNAVDDDGKPIFTNQKLVDFLPMGIQEDINVFTGQILAGINNLREVWGIAQGADGSTPQKYDGVRKTELSAQSSNAALFPTFNCFQYLFEDGFTDCVKKWQIIAKDRNLKLNYSPLGQKNMQILALDKEFTNADLNVQLVLGSTDQELQDLLNDIKELRAIGIKSNFTQGITTSEYIYLSETIKSGNVKQALWVMAKVEQKKIAQQAATDQQNQQNNSNSQIASAEAAEQMKQQTVSIDAKEKRMTIVLQEAEKRITAASTALINDYAKEGGPAAQSTYQKIIDEAHLEIVGVLKQDNAPQQQQSPDGQPPQQPDDSQQPPPQQMQQSA